ncbi:DNA-binding protein [Streptomyces sp. NPDC052225]|uniref:DNA-binding protein n=1 Tax=Streptomyces sp. NPDC052225 TaxID=3154949 RepID=UPI00343556DC
MRRRRVVVRRQLGTDGFPGAGHALLYAYGKVPQLDTVQPDTARGSEFTHAGAQLVKYRAHPHWTDKAALAAEPSGDPIRAIARDL